MKIDAIPVDPIASNEHLFYNALKKSDFVISAVNHKKE
jgi:hypothetical protein